MNNRINSNEDNRQNLSCNCNNSMIRTKFIRALYSAYTDELESISDCLYYGLILSEYDPDICGILDNIAVDDMRHFRKLGKLLVGFKVNPAINTKFRTGNTNMFPCADDNRMNSMAAWVADALISRKSAASDKYGDLLKDAPDMNIMNVLNSIAADEQKHRNMLMNYGMYI